MPRRQPLTTYVEWDEDAWAWGVCVPEEHDSDGRTLDSGREETEEAAHAAAEDALDEIQHRADIEETERHLRRWVLRGCP